MGFDSSTKHKDWVKTVSDYIRMEYPKGSTWGAVFVTVGEPTDTSRPYIDLSDYKKVSLELRGEENGETILIGLKDNTDPDDGSETKVRISNITTQWQTYEIELSRFRTANLHKLYVVTELVFERDPKILFLKNIKFLP